MADGKTAFPGKCGQVNLAIQVLPQKFYDASALPRCEPAFDYRGRLPKLTITLHKVRAHHQREGIHEQLREYFRPVKARQHQLGQVMEDRLGSSVHAV